MPEPPAEPPASPAWYPDVAAVAALVWTRTNDKVGVRGSFNDDTRPTADQVGELIALVAGEVSGAAGPDLPEVLHGRARRCVTLGAAAMVERSFFPEQQRGGEDQTAAISYGALYERALARLMEAVKSYSKTASAGGGVGLGSMRVRSGTLVDYEEALAAQAGEAQP